MHAFSLAIICGIACLTSALVDMVDYGRVCVVPFSFCAHCMFLTSGSFPLIETYSSTSSHLSGIPVGIYKLSFMNEKSPSALIIMVQCH